MAVLFASYNIHFGIGSDGRYDLERVAAAIAAADVICLQEVVQGWRRFDHVDQADQLARILDRYCYCHGAFDADASGRDEGGRIVNRRRTFGNAILSRWPIIAASGHILPKRALAEGFDLQRGLIEATLALPGGDLRLYNTHLSHVSSELRLPQLQAVLQTIDNAPLRGQVWDNAARETFVFSDPAPPVPAAALLMGDLNFRPQDPEYRSIAGRLADAWRLAGNGEDRESFAGAGRIDHCFVAPALAAAVRRAWIDDSTPASDHWPLFVELEI